jgi:phosphoribosylformylglycinamidine synthase
MFSLFGAPALSQFRLDQLLRALTLQEPRVQALSSRWMHFVDTSRPLQESELEVLGKLLTYGARVPDALRELPSGHASARSRPGRARPPILRTSAALTP